jgi:hypothetical protein
LNQMALLEHLHHRHLLLSHIGPQPALLTDLGVRVRKVASLLKRQRLLSRSPPPCSRTRPSEESHTGIARYGVPGGLLRMGRIPTRQYVSRALVASVCSHTFLAVRIHIAHVSHGSAPVE